MDTQLAPCSVCKEKKSFDEFYRSKGRRPYGLSSACKPCSQKKRRAWHAENDTKETRSEMWRRSNLKRKFGITPEQYEQMLEAQKGVCGICHQPESDVHFRTGQPQRLAVDHDAETGRVRGLLCALCNKGIGSLRHDKARLLSAIRYLDESQNEVKSYG